MASSMDVDILAGNFRQDNILTLGGTSGAPGRTGRCPSASSRAPPSNFLSEWLNPLGGADYVSAHAPLVSRESNLHFHILPIKNSEMREYIFRWWGIISVMMHVEVTKCDSIYHQTQTPICHLRSTTMVVLVSQTCRCFQSRNFGRRSKTSIRISFAFLALFVL